MREALFAAVWLAAMLVAATAPTPAPTPDLPRCPEDAVLIGSGSFDGGRYSSYVCGPAVDDYSAR